MAKGVQEYLAKLLLNMDGLDEDIKGRKVNVRKDHIHIVVVISPRVSVANVIKYMKSSSGTKLKEKFEFMRTAMYGRGGYGQEVTVPPR